MSDISISKAQREALLADGNVKARLSPQAQDNLAQGKPASRNIDNSVDYFRSRSLQQRSEDLIANLDGVEQGIRVISRALEGLESADNLLSNIEQFLTSNQNNRNISNEEIASLINQNLQTLNQTINNAGFEGTNLLNDGQARLDIQIGQNAQSILSVEGLGLNGQTLFAFDAFNSDNDGIIDGFSLESGDFSQALSLISDARGQLQTQGERLATNIAVLQTRYDFASPQIQAQARNAAQNITPEELSEEAANLLALQTRSQLGVRNFAIAPEQQRGIISLLDSNNK